MLREAAGRGFITPDEIASVIPPKVAKDQKQFAKAITSIRTCLQLLGVIIVTAEVQRKIAEAPPVPTQPREISVKPILVKPSPVREVAAVSKPSAEKPSLDKLFKTEPKREKQAPASQEKRIPASAVVLEEEGEKDPDWVDYYETDLLGIYLKSVHRLKRLTDEEVVALSRAVLESWVGEEDNQTLTEEGIGARNKLVVHNLRLAKQQGFAFRGLGAKYGIDVLDLMQEANLGLMKAAEDFDYRLGYRFSTYATWWMRSAISRAVADNGRLVRIPAHQHEKWGRIRKTVQKFIEKFGHEPRPRTVAALLGLTEAAVVAAQKEMLETPGYVDPMVKLDWGWDENPEDADFGGTGMQAVTADPTCFDPDQLVQAKEELGQALHRIRLVLGVAKFAPSLTERDMEIFRGRYGLDGSFQVKTLEAVAERYGITRERIRQIVDIKVWPKLRELGVKQGDEWLREELERIRQLENLTGIEASL